MQETGKKLAAIVNEYKGWKNAESERIHAIQAMMTLALVTGDQQYFLNVVLFLI